MSDSAVRKAAEEIREMYVTAVRTGKQPLSKEEWIAKVECIITTCQKVPNLKSAWICECGHRNRFANIRCSKCKVYPPKPIAMPMDALSALKGLVALFTGEPKFYIQKLGSPITNADQSVIDAAFIAANKVIRDSSPRPCVIYGCANPAIDDHFACKDHLDAGCSCESGNHAQATECHNRGSLGCKYAAVADSRQGTTGHE